LVLQEPTKTSATGFADAATKRSHSSGSAVKLGRVCGEDRTYKATPADTPSRLVKSVNRARTLGVWRYLLACATGIWARNAVISVVRSMGWLAGPGTAELGRLTRKLGRDLVDGELGCVMAKLGRVLFAGRGGFIR
jgi:hypothetical protein